MAKNKASVGGNNFGINNSGIFNLNITVTQALESLVEKSKNVIQEEYGWLDLIANMEIWVAEVARISGKLESVMREYVETMEESAPKIEKSAGALEFEEMRLIGNRTGVKIESINNKFDIAVDEFVKYLEYIMQGYSSYLFVSQGNEMQIQAIDVAFKPIKEAMETMISELVNLRDGLSGLLCHEIQLTTSIKKMDIILGKLAETVLKYTK